MNVKDITSFEPNRLKKILVDKNLTLCDLSLAMGRDKTFMSYTMKKGSLPTPAYQLMLRILEIKDEDLQPPKTHAQLQSNDSFSEEIHSELSRISRLLNEMYTDIKTLKLDMANMKDWSELFSGVVDNIEHSCKTQKLQLEKIKEAVGVKPMGGNNGR